MRVAQSSSSVYGARLTGGRHAGRRDVAYVRAPKFWNCVSFVDVALKPIASALVNGAGLFGGRHERDWP